MCEYGHIFQHFKISAKYKNWFKIVTQEKIFWEK
jgi:hypothetical protein